MPWLEALRDEVRILLWGIKALRRSYRRAELLESILRASPGIAIDRSAIIRSPERLKLGHEVNIESGVLLHCGGADWSHGAGGISIGHHTYIGPYAVLFGAGGIEIGDDVLISPHVIITSHQHSFADPTLPMRRQPIRFAKVQIGSNVWIGANAAILPGVSVGDGAVVAAGAVVTRDVPPFALVAGVPARVLRHLKDQA